MIILFNMYSSNSMQEKDCSVLFNSLSLFLGGFIAAYRLFMRKMFTWLVESFCDVYICFKFSSYMFSEMVVLFISSYMFSEMVVLFISNCNGVMLVKLYSFAHLLRFDILCLLFGIS